jgi:hypothetical protein
MRGSSSAQIPVPVPVTVGTASDLSELAWMVTRAASYAG